MITLYQFQKKKYIPLVILLNVYERFCLDEDFLQYIRSDLCFYYYGDIYYINNKSSFKGMLKLEYDLLKKLHIEAALYFSTANDLQYNSIFLPIQEMIEINHAYSIGGSIKSEICFINNEQIISVNEGKLFLPNKILPYYLIDTDLLSEYIHDNILTNEQFISILNNSQIKPIESIPIELGENLGTPDKPSAEILQVRLNQQKEENEHLNLVIQRRIEHVRDYKDFLEESRLENAGLREQLKVLLAEIASFRPKTKNTKQLQREALLEKLLVAMENLALEKAKVEGHEDFIFSREYIRATREDMQNALKRLEYLKTGYGTLFTIELSTFEGFWKKQTLCRLAVGVGQSIDTHMLLDELFYINND